ncbi:MAG TPA: hypothetical protein VIG25_13725 [Pyrinomonadaceae bacterium]|jgi:hypothetical protein
MKDLPPEMTTRAHELLQTLVPEDKHLHDDSGAGGRTSLSDIVISPEEVLFLPVSPVEELPEACSDTNLQYRLRKEIDLAIANIEDCAVKEVAETMLCEISQLFSRLSLVESNLRKLDTLQENLSILEMMQFDIHSLVQYIRFKAINIEGLSEKLHDLLEGISYGISHDAKRIFEQGLLGNVAKQTTPVVYGKILHAHGLLTNCFQQSVITILQAFNPTVDALKIFDDFEQRLRQSLSLCRDLSSLMRVVHHTQLDRSPDNLRTVVDAVMEFRDGSMQYLMYRDWRGYERLALELLTAIEHNRDTKDLLHQFACYLEVLYGHVKMRAVLRDMFPSQTELTSGSQDSSGLKA